ncbi:hypothetical protein NPIL_239611 [Nephila pilipes]|uniref:Uncharacterized protein n=1 Tax=Nephila pilipes TaxID=299642 RepID=A0A8X6QV70_NEPPI|nr:hypothetical protein NPIL_239611 [Nephila pilipes]
MYSRIFVVLVFSMCKKREEPQSGHPPVLRPQAAMLLTVIRQAWQKIAQPLSWGKIDFLDCLRSPQPSHLGESLHCRLRSLGTECFEEVF